MSTVPVEHDALDGWARFADEIRSGSMRIRTDVACKRLADAQEKLAEQHLAAASALVSLYRAGAALPADVAPPEATPFHLLDTPATRRLVSALRAAYEAARAVDRERFPDADDDVEAMPFGEMLVKWEGEVYGPAGRGEGAER